MKTAYENSKEEPAHPVGTETVASYAVAPLPPGRMPETLRACFIRDKKKRPLTDPMPPMITDAGVPR